MAYLCNIYTEEDEYEIYLEHLLMRKGRYLSVRKNGQPQEAVYPLPKRWAASKANLLATCGIKSEQSSFSWKDR